MTLEVHAIGDAESTAWNRYVNSRPDASHYHLYAWRGFFGEFFSKQTLYLAAYRNKRIVGIVPLVRQKSLLFGDFLVSLPFLNYGGILADSDAVGLAIMRKAIELAESLGVSHIELREFRERTGLRSRTEKVSMQLKLPATTEELGKSLGSKIRSQIRRPLRENPKISVGSIEFVDRFYRIFSRNMRDLGTPVYPKSMFVEIMRRFPDESNIVLIEIAGRPVAAAFLLHFRDTTEVPWASTDRKFNPLSVNMLLYWESLKVAIGRGTKVFDFGRSTIHSGTYRFKKQWGAKPVQLCWNYWIKDGGVLPKINPENPKYSLAIKVWKRLPLPFSRLVGPLLVRNLP